jgi:MFS family permease
LFFWLPSFFVRSFGMTLLNASLYFGAVLLIGGIAGLWAGGWLGDRFPRRLIIALGVGGVGVCTLITGLLGSYYSLLVLFGFTGLFAGLYHPSGIALLSDQTEERQRGRALATHLVGGSAGYFITPLLGGLIATLMGWQSAFMLLCIPALISAPLAIIYLPRGEAPGSHKPKPNPIPRAGFSWRPVITMVILAITMELVTGSAVAFFALFLVDMQGFTPGLAAMWIGLLRGGSVVGSFLGGYLADRWGRR